MDTGSLHQLQKNAISAFMEYGQRIGRQPTLECRERRSRLFSGNQTFVAVARLEDEVICEAEAPNKKDAKTKAADKALRQMEASPGPSQGTGGEPEMRLAVPGKDPVSALMEYAQAQGLTATIVVEGQTGPAHCPTFIMYAKLGDRKFESIEHANKKEGRKRAANTALLKLQREGKIPRPRSGFCQRGSQNDSGSDDYKDICPPRKNPLQVFNELAQARGVTCDVIETADRRGQPHDLTFTMAAVLNDIEFESVTGKNKNQTKNRATAAALRQLLETGDYELPSAQRGAERIPQVIRSWDDRIATETLQKFRSVVSDVEADLSGRKVLAAILLYDKKTDTLSVVSLGTGNRCITGNYLCVEGSVIHDSHAEIIAARGFRRYLYEEVRRSESSGGSEVLGHTSGRLRLFRHLSFHLYISTAPCGDGAVYTRADPSNEDNVHLPVYRTQQHGLLRTKVENGEGTIPVENASQTLDGIRRGDQRLRTMSCSDKICRWNVLGLQGALLSLRMDPIYLSSITLGMLFSAGHMSRAVCCRAARNPDLLSGLPTRYKVTHPELGCVSEGPQNRVTDRSSPRSVNWNSADGTVELTDGANGKTIRNAPSRLCKRSLFQCFSHINPDRARRTYRQTKDLATDYRNSRNLFEDAMETNGYGPWVRKPPEVDMFYL
ncbi:double-stranded RNA-specific adenosine deaminase-like isoform X1 [Crassostrea virginica]